MKTKSILEAHRGVSNEYPENTLAAFRKAAELGYAMIELDTKFTVDDVCVALHDRTLTRTARNADGSIINGEINISSVTLEEARRFDFGIHKGERFKGEMIPTLCEILSFAERADIPLKFDNVLWSHKPEQREAMFSAFEKTKAKIGITCSTIEQVSEIAVRLPMAHIHYDGAVNDEALMKLSQSIDPERLTVWMRFDNECTSWNKNIPVNREWSEKIHRIGSLGVWLLTKPEELIEAMELGAELAETDGSLRP